MMIPFLRIFYFSCQLSKITAYDDVKNSGQHYTEKRMLRARLGSPMGSLTSLTSQNSVPVGPAQAPRPRPSKPAQVTRPKPTKPAQLPKRTPIATGTRPVTEASAPSSTSLAPISNINPLEGTNVTVLSTMFCGVKFSNGSFACYSVGVPCTSRSDCTGLVNGTITFNQCITECGPSLSK
jgi:hypothetical protein